MVVKLTYVDGYMRSTFGGNNVVLIWREWSRVGSGRQEPNVFELCWRCYGLTTPWRLVLAVSARTVYSIYFSGKFGPGAAILCGKLVRLQCNLLCLLWLHVGIKWAALTMQSDKLCSRARLHVDAVGRHECTAARASRSTFRMVLICDTFYIQHVDKIYFWIAFFNTNCQVCYFS